MIGITLEDFCGHDEANKNCLTTEDGTLLSEDLSILIRVKCIFAGSGFGGLATVGIRFELDQIVLYGPLPSYFLMQMAQELSRPVLDHRNLVNRCSVVDQHER